MIAVPLHPLRLLPPAARPRGRRAGFTLVEVMIALSIFIIGALGVIECIGLINNNATVDRALTSARTLVGAKIAKAQTDPWLPSSNTVPMACNPALSGTQVGRDTTDNLDFPADIPLGTPSSVVLVVTSPDTGPVITGTMYQYLSTFEAASQSMLITYTLTFTYRGKSYSVSQSTIRSPDLL